MRTIEISVKPTIKNDEDGTIKVPSVNDDTQQSVVPPSGANSQSAPMLRSFKRTRQLSEPSPNARTETQDIAIDDGGSEK